MNIFQRSNENLVSNIIEFCAKNDIRINGELVNGNWLSGEVGLWRKNRLTSVAMPTLLEIVFTESITADEKTNGIKLILEKINDKATCLSDIKGVVSGVKDGLCLHLDYEIGVRIIDNTDGTYEIKVN